VSSVIILFIYLKYWYWCYSL